MTKAIVLDSDIFIDFLRTGKGLYLDVLKVAARDGIDLFLSPVTIFEIFVGSSSKAQRNLILKSISNFKTISFDSDLGRFIGELKRDHRLNISFADLIIGGTALSMKAEIATRNRKHFESIPGLKFFGV